MNNSTDFQPPTRNPQSNVGGGLQTSGANLQPGANSTSQAGELNPNILPLTNVLKVTTASNGSSAKLAPDSNLQVTNAISSGWFFGVVTILTIIIFWIFGKIFNPAKNTKATDAAEPVVIEKPAVASPKPKKKSKKKTSKKNYKKKK